MLTEQQQVLVQQTLKQWEAWMMVATPCWSPWVGKKNGGMPLEDYEALVQKCANIINKPALEEAFLQTAGTQGMTYGVMTEEALRVLRWVATMRIDGVEP